MITRVLLSMVSCFLGGGALAQTDWTFVDGRGQVVAYVVLNHDMNIYMWSGEAVAYMLPNGSDGFQLYRFNGKHMGWYTQGLLIDHRGDTVCVRKEALDWRAPIIEPVKSKRLLAPTRGVQEQAPVRPPDTRRWSATRCRQFLGEGVSE